MEKRWLGSVSLILVLVLLVLGVGYSAGNSITGYQFFDKIFKKVATEDKAIAPSPRTETGRCSCELRLQNVRGGEAVLNLNGETYRMREGDNVNDGSCVVLLVDARDSSALFDVNGEAVDLKVRNGEIVEECLPGSRRCSCWITFDRFESDGGARIRVNGAETFALRAGDSASSSECGVIRMLDVSRSLNSISLDVHGNLIHLFRGSSRNVDECLSRYESDCACDVRYIRSTPDGAARIAVNEDLFEVREGDNVLADSCEVTLLDMDEIAGSISLDVNGQIVELRSDFYG